jgi:hypothetical protein
MNMQWIQQQLSGWTYAAHRAKSLTAICCIGIAMSTGGAADVHGQQGSATGKANRKAAAGSKSGSLFSHGDQAFRVVRAEDYTEGAIVGEPVQSGLTPVESYTEIDPIMSGEHVLGSGTLASGNCGGSCRSCGGHTGSSGGYGVNCPRCESYWYGSIELLSMSRDSDRQFSVVPRLIMTDFESGWAPRITFGTVPDCVHGYELSFTGAFQWDRAGIRTEPNGGIDTLLNPAATIQTSDISAFQNAITQAQFLSTEYWSMEASNTMVGWDVAKLLCGFRYIDYEEDFAVFSRNATEFGAVRTNLDNQMLGYQVGMDLLYPLCERLYTELRGRAGVYANFVDLDLRAVNDDLLVGRLTDESTELAGQFELGSGFRYQFSQCFSIRTGIEVWYLSGVASVRDQLKDGIFGRRKILADDDIWITGWNIGTELRF